RRRAEQHVERGVRPDRQHDRGKSCHQRGNERGARNDPGAHALLTDEQTERQQRQRMGRHAQRMQQTAEQAAHLIPLRKATPARAMPVSTPGTGTPRIPITPPNAITSGKTIGSTQIAGAPRNAPQRPTATMATTWSGPNSGCANPPMNPPDILPVWAEAGMPA